MGFCTFILHTTSFVVGNILLFYRLNPELRAGYLLLSAISEGILRLQLPLYPSRYFFFLALVINGEYGDYLGLGRAKVALFVCMQYLIIYFVWCRQYKT